MTNSSTLAGRRLFGAYYAATAVFLLLDFAFGLNLRLSFLADLPGWRLAWYLLCALCFLLIWRYPAWSNTVAAGESLLNLSALILYMGSRVIVTTDAVLETGRAPVSANELFNFLISGSAAYAAFWLHSRRARQDLGAQGRK